MWNAFKEAIKKVLEKIPDILDDGDSIAVVLWTGAHFLFAGLVIISMIAYIFMQSTFFVVIGSIAMSALVILMISMFCWIHENC